MRAPRKLIESLTEFRSRVATPFVHSMGPFYATKSSILPPGLTEEWEPEEASRWIWSPQALMDYSELFPGLESALEASREATLKQKGGPQKG